MLDWLRLASIATKLPVITTSAFRHLALFSFLIDGNGMYRMLAAMPAVKTDFTRVFHVYSLAIPLDEQVKSPFKIK